jgi:hypothetical protein
VWSTGVLGVTYPLAIALFTVALFSGWSAWYCKCGSLPLVFVHGVDVITVLMCVLTGVGNEARCGVNVGVALQISGWVARSVFH